MKENLWLSVVTYLVYCIDDDLWKAIEYVQEQVWVLREQQEKDRCIRLDDRQRTRPATKAKRLTERLLEVTMVLFAPSLQRPARQAENPCCRSTP
jgi:hypothetical protein